MIKDVIKTPKITTVLQKRGDGEVRLKIIVHTDREWFFKRKKRSFTIKGRYGSVDDEIENVTFFFDRPLSKLERFATTKRKK